MATGTQENNAAAGINDSANEVERRGGFAVGDAVIVTAKGSTYHGEKGVVGAFCKNGKAEMIYVDLENSGRNRLSIKSISLREIAVENPTAPGTITTTPMDNASVGTLSTRSSSNIARNGEGLLQAL